MLFPCCMLKATGEDTIICVFNVKYQWFFIQQEHSCIRKTTWGKKDKKLPQSKLLLLIKNVSVTQLTPQLISFRKGKNDCCKTTTSTDRRGSGLMKMILLHYTRDCECASDFHTSKLNLPPPLQLFWLAKLVVYMPHIKNMF